MRPSRHRLLRLRVFGRAPVLLCVVIVGLGVGTAGCASTETGQAVPADTLGATSSASAAPRSSQASESADLSRFYDQKIAWGGCEKFLPGDDGYPKQRSRCGMLTVPVDYTRPDGATAQIAVYKLSATGPRIGSLMMNPGGPGASAVTFVAGQAADLDRQAVSRRFDLVGFDPRGVGSSTPEIRCRTDADRDRDRARDDTDWSPAGIARMEGEARDDARKCSSGMGDEYLAHLGTVDVAHDMDVLRSALGDDKLNYLGYSYGTRIGASYAEQFPDRIRAMVNDGAVDPAADPVAENLRQNEGFQKAFDDFAKDCATRPDCALGTDPTTSTQRFQQLVRPLINRPARTADPRGLSYGDAQTGTSQALYSKDLWKYLRRGLGELTQGRGDTILRLADLYEGRDKDGAYDNSADAFTAIRCVDDPPITDRATVDRLETDTRRVAPFRDDGRGTGHGAEDACAFWPVPNTSTPHRIDAPGLPPTVVVSTTNDPATPYAAGVDLAKQLDARLITYRGTQHTVSFEGVRCVDDAVNAYFVDLTLPKVGLTC
ncbi:alpha/beta hydrolase [Williamsia sterculiae]|uniref:Tripeptidyl-peptidase B. Serine peptidase. MEROPS family S33 n=1 Tax=Williamsia sterculiae TaxID=1344003 RepID=A0A1N7G9I3_9NOCA|nr:alpha/beta hydrolase [Williamsia sterculiae]SIS09285.1 tripeptidyl-peptidase B. Serine peptidase. MEROPS family S33 [Williamsia sterculiae]